MRLAIDDLGVGSSSPSQTLTGLGCELARGHHWFRPLAPEPREQRLAADPEPRAALAG
ncbi:MAG: hypothetical protein AVDCRST_MAG38-2799 [uncultured Solirubrobacteraceae bacterium]|uniref:EAL domain-containing protein n=1 Tax=uncultured Solirubrobacteraceae bacterium TaxID=1162706 RepID=A0A6J4SH40_9ACTN|nr:MAG: hypothetical protein AVDCRST_MAG38-2799 [uncultured Solirubrobacteraceae bacterium]